MNKHEDSLLFLCYHACHETSVFLTQNLANSRIGLARRSAAAPRSPGSAARLAYPSSTDSLSLSVSGGGRDHRRLSPPLATSRDPPVG